MFIDLNKALLEYENHLIDQALKGSNGVKARAAKELNINRTSLVEKLRRRGMIKPKARKGVNYVLPN